MERSNPRHAKTHKAGWYLLPACVVGLVLAISCTNIGGGGGGDNTNDNGQGSPQRDEILSLRNNFNVSGSGQITIQYNVVAPATVSAFYVQVESPTTGSPDIGTPVVFAANAPAGNGQVVTLVYSDLETGAYQVGLNISRPSGNSTVRSQGYLIIEAPPDPEFLAPTENLQIHQGEFVDISFDNRKTPATRVRWRLFYKTYDVRDTDQDVVFNALDQCPQTSVDERGQVDAFGCGPTQLAAGDDFDGDGVPNNADECPATTTGLDVDRAGCSQDQLGIELAIGDGNENTFRWDTTGVQRANYRLGVSATDTGQSIAATFAADSSRIVTKFAAAIVSIDEPAPPPTPPTLVFNKPIKDVQTFGTEIVEIEFDATIRTAGATGSVDIFLDDDTTPNNGNEIVLLDDASVDTTTTSFSTANLQEGIYNVGGTIDDSANIPVTVYAAGRVDVVKNAALAVNEPSSPLPVRPNANVQVAWTTNVPPHVATLEVYAQRVNAQGQPEGAEIQIRPPGPPLSGTDTDIFRPTESGVYRVFVRVDFTIDDRENLLKPAPADVRVTTLPPTLWLGEFAAEDARIDGAILEGVNFEDNLGTSVIRVPDLNGDDADELLVVARYGKPGFKNPNGLGEGEAYLIYGTPDRLVGPINANETGKDLMGITFTGIRTRGEPANREQTQGLSAVAVIPDLDDDGLPELVFSFPRTLSRGHNIDVLQDGLTPDQFLTSLERPGQFLRGGLVIVSSKNRNLIFPENDQLSPVIRLDLVGQQFEVNGPAFGGVETAAFADIRSRNPCLDEEVPCQCPLECPDGQECPPAQEEETACIEYCGTPVLCSELCDAMGDDCWGDCLCPNGGEEGDGQYDAMTGPGQGTGFVGPLADTWYERYYCQQDWDCGFCVGSMVYPVPVCSYVYDPMTCPDPLHQNDVCRTGGCTPFKPVFSDVGLPGQSGFYPTWNPAPPTRNNPIEPFGARIIGLSTYGGPQDGDHFGTSMTVSNSNPVGPAELLVSAPDRRQAVPTLGLNQQNQCVERGVDGEVNNMLDTNDDGCPDPIAFPGIVYMINFEIENRSGQRRPYNLWEDDPVGRIPPKPHQYMVGTPSHCESFTISNTDSISGRIENPEAIRIIGQANERIKNILGVDDFNDDGREDIMVGVPEANGAKGHVYVAFRREKRLEGDYVLGKLALAPNNPNRLDGIFVVWADEDNAAFGTSLATGVDFNHDGLSDLVIGAPNARASTGQQGQFTNGVGSVIIVFSNPNLVTPQGGITVGELLRTGRAVKITGNFLDENGNFGFNVADGGDIDGDGHNDLLIAAPGATPRFDPTPTDAVDALTEPGLDQDFDGVRDDIATEYGLAGFDNAMTRAGVVYVISGANDFSETPNGEVSVRQLGTDALRGMIVAGRRSLDFLGGGDAGDAANGGNAVKATRGRSFGLATAGDLDGDGKADFTVGSVLADPRRDRITGEGVRNGGEVYIIYGGTLPEM